MSQAEELLNAMSEEVPVHTHPVPDTDTYFVIDPVTRKIENTNPKKHVIMQYDHNSERCTFELPRFIDGHDMLECTSVTVNVDNIEVVESEGAEEAEPVEPRINSDAPDMTDLRIHPNDPEKVISSWLISRNSTQLAGILSFHIEYKCVDSNGNVVYEWSTDNFDEIEVRARKKNGEASIAGHTDLLEQWRTRIFGAGDSVMANIAAEGETQIAAVKAESETQQEAVELKGAQTLDSIPEDYTEVDAMAEEAVRSKGDAIVCEVSGKTLGFADASDNYIRGLNVFGKSTQLTTTGKNLFKTGFVSGHTETVKGVTFTVNPDGSIHVKGTPNAAIAYNIFEGEALPVGNYFISGAPETAGQKFRLQVNLTVDSTEKTGGVDMGVGSKFSVDASVSSLRGYIYVASDAGAVEGTFYPQIELGTTATSYEPYTGGKPSPNPEYPQEIVSIGDVGSIGLCLTTNNLFDKDVNVFVDGTTIDKTTGEIVTTSGNGWRTFENLLMVQPHTAYVISGSVVPSAWTCTVAFYDSNKSYLTFVNIQNNGGKNLLKFTTPDKAVYLRFTAHANSLDANTIAVNAGTSAIEYQAGYTQSLSFKSANGLPGIPVTSGGNYTDENGQQWICDEIDLERGVYVKRLHEETYDGSDDERWKKSGESYFYLIKESMPYKSRVNGGAMSTRFRLAKGSLAEPGLFMIGNAYGPMIRVQNDVVDETGLRAWIANNPFSILYELATPIKTPLTAEEITAFKALRTNYPNTTILNDAGAWMSVKYNADTKSYVDKPKTLRLTDTSTGVVYELKVVDGNLTVVPV